MKEILIAGAGFSGSVVARILAEKGYKVTIHEQRSTIGGNAFDENINGIISQKYGPHIFHTSSKEVVDFLSKYTEWFEYKHSVKGKIDGKLVPIPFNLTSLEALFDNKSSNHIKDVLFKEIGLGKKVPVMQLRRHKDKEIQKFGDYVFNKVFYNYTLKQWDMEPTELNPTIMERVPVNVSYQDMYFPNDLYQVMPKFGFTPMFEKMLDHPNIKVILNSNILDILTFEKNNIYLNGKLFEGEVIFTGCIDELFNYKYGKLPYRTLDFEFETHNTTSYQEASVVNYPNEEAYTRISEFSKFTCSPIENYSIIVKEYPRAHKIGDIPYYPIEIKENILLYEKYLELAKRYTNLHLLGRLANYKYINMDLAVLNAINLAKSL